MANVGSSLPPFRGPWVDGTEYVVGDLVSRAGALWQAKTDTNAQPGSSNAVAGRGNPGSWLDVSAIVLQATGSVDVTTGDGMPAAVASTYQRAGIGLLVKTGSGVTAWEAPGGGGAPAAHAASHQNGGSDEIDVTGLDGAGGLPVTVATTAATDADGSITVTSVDGDADATVTVQATGGGDALADRLVESGTEAGDSGEASADTVVHSNDGNASSSTDVWSLGDGDAESLLQATVQGSGTALAGLAATGGGTFVTLFLTNGADGIRRIAMAVDVLTIAGLPASDPGNPGQLYTDGAPSAGVPKALKVSGG